MTTDTNSYIHMSETELSTAAGQGDFDAYEELAERFSRDFYAWAYALIRNEEGARSVLADAIIQSWHGCKKLKAEGQLIKFMYRTMYGIAKKRNAADMSFLPDSTVQEYQAQMINDTYLLMSQSLNKMSFDVRAQVLLSCILNKTPAEIGKYTNIPKERVTANLIKAKQKLRDDLGMSPAMIDMFFKSDREFVNLYMKSHPQAAVRQGLTAAREGKYVMRQRSWAAGTAVIILGFVLLYAVYHPWEEKGAHDLLNREGTRVVPDDSYWLSGTGLDLVSRKHVEQGDVQRLGYAMEHKGLRLIIDGMMTQGTRTTIFYTLTAEDGGPLPDKVGGYMHDRGSIPSTASTSFVSGNRIVPSQDPSKMQGIMVFNRVSLMYDPSAVKEWSITFNTYTEDRQDSIASMTLIVPAEPYKEPELIMVNREFELHSRSFLIQQVELAQNYTKISIEAETNHQEDILMLRRLGISLSRDEIYWPAYEGSNDVEYQQSGTQFTLVYPPVYYLNYSDLSLYMENDGVMTLSIPLFNNNN
ncbi:sigma-70 family RNA polymerase sigma factor [Neobacillus mesonae]|nr:sigma-70 family RNA polymerase sigma factor [Neobacillus mesonae]